MTIDLEIEQALADSKPLEQMRSLVRQWQSRGERQSAIIDRLEHARLALHAADRDQDEDLIIEVIDFIVGWCSPHFRMDGESSMGGRG